MWLRQLLVVEHARETLRRFLLRFETELSNATIGLQDYLKSWVVEESDFDTTWDISFGDCARDIGTEGQAVEPVRVAVAVGLHLALAGHNGSWKTRLSTGTRLLARRCILPPCEELTVTATDHRVDILLTGPKGIENVRFDHGIPQGHHVNIDGLASVSLGRNRITLLSRAALQSAGFDEERPRSLEVVGRDVAADLTAALDVLRHHAPAYVPWVRDVLRYVLPVKRINPELLESGSSNRRPGVEVMSFPVGPAPCAELLVHESSHQYLYLVERMGPVDDGTDPTLYYSPIKQCGRPIRAILLAFHAFANVVLFYRMCRATGLEDGGYCDMQEERLVPQLEELMTPLRTSRAITPSGRGLWLPLAEAINA